MERPADQDQAAQKYDAAASELCYRLKRAMRGALSLVFTGPPDQNEKCHDVVIISNKKGTIGLG
jgi:hypothetical protein